MSLTGPWFFVAVLAVLVAVFAAVLWWWPRWGGPGRWALVSRALLLAGVNLLVLLTAGVALNDQYVFFADWTDLSGAVGLTDGGTPVVAHAGGDARGAVVESAGEQTPRTGALPGLPPQIRPGMRVARFTVTGAVSGITAQVVVGLPAGYADPAQRLRRYPVIEAFPGYPGGPFLPASTVQQVVRQRGMADPLVIAPAAEIPAGRDTECVDGPGRQPKVETWLTRDVPAWAERTLRVRTERTAWATLGWSAGGWCAAMAAMLHPDRYAAAVVLGGYFRPDFGPHYTPFAPGSAPWRRYDLVALAASAHPPAVALWVQTSHADRLSYPTSALLLARARAPLSVQSLVMEHAGHRVEVWQGLIPTTLRWLAATAAPFAPTPSRTAAGSGAGSPAVRPTAGPTRSRPPHHPGSTGVPAVPPLRQSAVSRGTRAGGGAAGTPRRAATRP